MRGTAALLSFLLAASADADETPAAPPSEATFCADELDTLERRRRLFEREGLPEDEVQRQNASQLRALLDCRERLRAKRREADEAAQDADEVARRAGRNPTEAALAAARRQVRLERLASKRASSLTKEERAELAEGTKAEMAATHAALDRAHARDRDFMRTVHSAIACYEAGRKEALENQLASEETLVKLGSGDKNALYTLRGELRHADDALARSRDFGRAHPLGLEPCDSASVALLAHCIGVQNEGKPAFAACEPEDVQQYLRFAK
jgi:hypothetical protein